jgi:exodeoxyribonuclease VII small subunit
MNFEENIEQLEKVVQELESGNLNLEDSIKKFEEGINLSKKCNEILEEAEKKITVLVKKDDKVEEEKFE